MLRTADLDYHLPEEMIATAPASPRDSARMMVLRRGDPGLIEHRSVRDLPGYLRRGDVVVVNRSRVLPARFRGIRTDTGGRAEGLFLQEIGRADKATGSSAHELGLRWQVLLKARRTKPGVILQLFGRRGEDSPVRLRLVERVGLRPDEEASGWIADVEGIDADDTTAAVLARIGLAPLPPYILASRKRQGLPSDDERDSLSYQTVFAGDGAEGRGSVAAPTAGLHFTEDLLSRLDAAGVERAEVVLHVGMGTFKPVETEALGDHPMHSEWCGVPEKTARLLAGSTRTVIAVGTTTVRTLESFASPADMIAQPSKETRILIAPGHRFRHVGALMTNFHLPRSTLLALVAAFLDDDERVKGQGLARLLAAYDEAIRTRYRFYSFGDAMLILP